MSFFSLTSRKLSVREEVIRMCYNCGCGIPGDDHGKGHAGVDPEGKAITTKTFQAAGEVFEMDEKTSKKYTRKLLQKQSD
jgi:hypothetical protein